MKKLLALVIGLVVFLPGVAKADFFDKISVTNCSSGMANAGDTQTCTIVVTSSEPISKIAGKIRVQNSTYMELVNVTTAGAWSGTATTTDYNLTASTPQNGQFQILTYTIRAINGYSYATMKDSVNCGVHLSQLIVNDEPEDDTDVCDPATDPNGCCDPKTDPNGCCDPATDPDGCEAKNPDTGAFTSIIVVGGIAVLGFGAYIVAKNRNKFYKI